MATCNAAVRGGGECGLEAGHTGHHSTVVAMCDGCGRTRRASQVTTFRFPPGGDDGGIGLCFTCIKQDDRIGIRLGREELA